MEQPGARGQELDQGVPGRALDVHRPGARPRPELATRPARWPTALLEVPRKTVAETDVKTEKADGKIKNTSKYLKDLDKQNATPFADLFTVPFDGNRKQVMAQLRELDRERAEAEIDADPSGVQGAVATARGYLNGISGMTVTTYINTVRRVSGAISGAANAAMDAISGAGADGMTVPGQRAPYGDKHLFWLAPGEEVISNRYGQADRNRDLLKAINANRAADGTPGVRGTHARTPTSGIGDAAHATADSLRDLANASRDEMRERRKEIATRVKELTKERDARKEVLDALKAERDAVRSSITDRLTSDLFVDREAFNPEQPEGFETWAPERQRAWLNDQYQRHAATVQSPTDILRGDIGDAREMRRLIAQLSGRGGLTGDALSELLQEGGIEQLRAYASGPRSQLREYQAPLRHARPAGVADG